MDSSGFMGHTKIMSHPENTLKTIIEILRENDNDLSGLILGVIRNQINLIGELRDQNVLPPQVAIKLLEDINNTLNQTQQQPASVKIKEKNERMGREEGGGGGGKNK